MEEKNIDTKRYLSKFIINKNSRFFILKERERRNITTSGAEAFVPVDGERGHPLHSETTGANVVEFWRIINKLNWKDKSDGICNKYTIYKLSSKERNFLKLNISIYTQQLQLIINSDDSEINASFIELSSTDKQEFLYHITAKGVDFYNACILEPAFCQYILGENEIQTLYAYL